MRQSNNKSRRSPILGTGLDFFLSKLTHLFFFVSLSLFFFVCVWASPSLFLSCHWVSLFFFFFCSR
ncbi:hypothetical protein BC940DRAFT_370363, partial [Gongronella butleri]